MSKDVAFNAISLLLFIVCSNANYEIDFTSHLFMSCFNGYRTNFNISGKVIARDGREPLPGAYVLLLDPLDKEVKSAIADDGGNFMPDKVKNGTYSLITIPSNPPSLRPVKNAG